MHHSTPRSRVVLFGFSLLVLGNCLIPTSAQAGFQWVTPSDGSYAGSSVVAPDPQRYSRSAPATRELDIISPLVIEGTSPTNSSMALSPSAALSSSAPVPLSQDLSAEPSYDLSPMKPADKEEKPVSGFANKVPLAVALRQILPSSFGFSVDQDVKLTTLVSWQGGKSWRDVMRDMLQSAGLDMREQDRMVRIVRGKSAPVAEPEMALASPQRSLGEPTSYNEPKTKTFNEPLPVKTVPEHTLQLPSTYAGFSAADAVPLSSLGAPSRVSIDTWSASRGDMLRKVFENWARKAHVELNWMSEYDYPLQASITLTGSFEDAVRNILAGFQEAQPQPVATLHASSNAGQSVLIVEARGNNYSE